jgi:DNA repair exonuclease SbcCD ATPase subunit
MSRKISAVRNFKEQLATHKDNIFVGLFASFVLGALLFLTIWMNEISKSSGSTSNIQEERIALLEEQIILVDATYADFITQTSADLKLFDAEIRKLWDLSNKRNRKDIEKLRDSVDKLILNNNKFSEEFNLVSKNFKSIRSDLTSIQEEVNELVLVSSGVNSLNSKLNELTTRLSFAEENLRSFENYRKSLNQTLIEIQASINSADKSLEAEAHESAMDNL